MAMIGSWGRVRGRIGRGIAALAVLAAVAPVEAAGPLSATGMEARSAPADEATFRPTVLVRKGSARGSGSIIASVAGETLILTVAHAVQEPGRLLVELHRYNLGLEGLPESGRWPRLLPAEVAAADAASDLAVLRVRGAVALPYVARLAEGDAEPEPGTVVTSLGIDRATHLSSWRARVRGGVDWDLKRAGVERPFLITDRAPDHGRSGGGLFLDDGTLVGVCVGRIEITDDRALGLFAPGASVHRLLREHHLEAAVARSASLRPLAGGTRAPAPPARAPVTATDHRARGH